MSQATSIVVSALERAADLIDRGLKPAAALKQTCRELADFDAAHQGQPVPMRPFQLGDPSPVRERAI